MAKRPPPRLQSRELLYEALSSRNLPLPLVDIDGCRSRDKSGAGKTHQSPASAPSSLQIQSQSAPIIPGINVSYWNTLDLQCFALMTKDPTYCYKFYWLETLVKLITRNIQETTFDAVIDEMIISAWYSVTEFHVHLSGLKPDGTVGDGLERSVTRLQQISQLPSNASPIEIQNAIAFYNPQIAVMKEQLTHMVPYRALAAFFQKTPEQPS